jgi:hypothetical protein
LWEKKSILGPWNKNKNVYLYVTVDVGNDFLGDANNAGAQQSLWTICCVYFHNWLNSSIQFNQFYLLVIFQAGFRLVTKNRFQISMNITDGWKKLRIPIFLWVYRAKEKTAKNYKNYVHQYDVITMENILYPLSFAV